MTRLALMTEPISQGNIVQARFFGSKTVLVGHVLDMQKSSKSSDGYAYLVEMTATTGKPFTNTYERQEIDILYSLASLFTKLTGEGATIKSLAGDVVRFSIPGFRTVEVYPMFLNESYGKFAGMFYPINWDELEPLSPAPTTPEVVAEPSDEPVWPENVIERVVEQLRAKNVYATGLGNKVALLDKGGLDYLINDNGGEIMVDLLNVWEHAVPVPTCRFNQPLTIATIVYRILQVMQGREVDYNLDLPEPVIPAETTEEVE